MKPSIHLSRAKGYRELGMHDESMLELEEITDDDIYLFEVIESKYLTCKAAKKWGHAEAYSNGMRIYHPNRVDGWILLAESLSELHGAGRQQRLCCWTKSASVSPLDMSIYTSASTTQYSP